MSPGTPGAARQIVTLLDGRLARLDAGRDPEAWKARARGVREAVLRLLARGHPPGLLAARPVVRRRETLAPGTGYRIRKLLYEGYPGLWIPALLYEPTAARRPLAAVLNPNGHHAGGLALPHKQARCINLAKRGLVALSFEFVGMGELEASRHHHRIAQLELSGMDGAGLFYHVMKRALDVLLAVPGVDPRRVAVTGLSGGGWQTLLLSALDLRVRASIPVAGHTAIWQRIRHPDDLGDLEQMPADLATVADYDVLSAMIAPRPVLFLYNHYDDCCFPTTRAFRSIVEPAREVYRLLGVEDRLEWHDNRFPGTHNYDRENRKRLYDFLGRRFGVDGPVDDLPWESEVLSEEELAVRPPPDNTTLLSLAVDRCRRAPSRRAPRDPRAARKLLTQLLRLSPEPIAAARRVAAGSSRRRGTTTERVVVGGVWTLERSRTRAALRYPPVRPREGQALWWLRNGDRLLALCDEGREQALRHALDRCVCRCPEPPAPPRPAGHANLVAADLLGTGARKPPWQLAMALSCAGIRPLGIQVAQIHALTRDLGRRTGVRVSLQATGLQTSIAALIAVALRPRMYRDLVTEGLPRSLARLTDWPVDYTEAAPLFCFGLAERFDIPDLLRLCRGVRVRDRARGPLTRLS